MSISWMPKVVDPKYPLMKTSDSSNMQLDEIRRDMNRVDEICIIVRDNESGEPLFVHTLKNIWIDEEHHTTEVWVNDHMEWSSN